MGNSYTIIVGKPAGKRSVERIMHGWGDNKTLL
jgi:hypothetical protein